MLWSLFLLLVVVPAMLLVRAIARWQHNRELTRMLKECDRLNAECDRSFAALQRSFDEQERAWFEAEGIPLPPRLRARDPPP